MSGRTLKSALKSSGTTLRKAVTVREQDNQFGETHSKFNPSGKKTRTLNVRSLRLPNAREHARRDIDEMKKSGLTDELFAEMEAREERQEMKRRQRYEKVMTPASSGPQAEPPMQTEEKGGRRKRRRKTRRRRH
jgi:hypothetical protein